MNEAQKILKKLRKERDRDEEHSGTRKGYWLVLPDKARYFISVNINNTALEEVCDRYLTKSTGWEYWIDYCYGLDITGRVAWANLDQTDNFI
jgi:hypothetical protein